MAVHRCTMFKVKDPADFALFTETYVKMQPLNKKNGQPYILSLVAGPTHADSDERHAGFNFAAMSRFASLEDMQYYDTEDAAHQDLKAVLKPRTDGVMTVYFKDTVGS